MSTDVVRKFRRSIPEKHRASADTRIQWLWMQRFGTIQTIWNETDDILDKTACTLFLQAVMAKDLSSIQLIFRRLEGGSLTDEENIERGALKI